MENAMPFDRRRLIARLEPAFGAEADAVAEDILERYPRGERPRAAWTARGYYPDGALSCAWVVERSDGVELLSRSSRAEAEEIVAALNALEEEGGPE